MHHIKRPHLKFRLHLKSRQQTHGRKEGSRRKKTANLVKLYEIFFQYPLLPSDNGCWHPSTGDGTDFRYCRPGRRKKRTSCQRKMSLGTSVLVGKASRCPHVPSSCFSNHSWKFKVHLCIVTYQAILAMVDEI